MKQTLLFILLIINSALAQNLNYTFSQLKLEDGLSQTTILSIMQDKKGYMWFGTGNGLNKFDGYTFKIFNHNPDDPKTISNNQPISMFEDKEGIIWIGTNDGILNRYNRNNETFDHITLTPDNENVIAKETSFDYPIVFSRKNEQTITFITEDNHNNLWIGTWGKGIFVYNKETRKIKNFYSREANISFNKVMRILIDEHANVWIATLGGGLVRIKNSSIKYNGKDVSNIKVEPINSVTSKNLIALFEDSQKKIWIGTYKEGMYIIPSSEKNKEAAQLRPEHHHKSESGLSSNSVMAFLEDSYKNIWIGTFGGGLDRVDAKTGKYSYFKNIPYNDNSLADNDVLSLYEDRSGIIWVGTHLGEGISKIETNKIKFNLISHIAQQKNSLSDETVWSIYKDHEDILWVGTYRGGVNRIDLKKNKYSSIMLHSESNLYNDNHVRSLIEDRNNNIWIGWYSNGLSILNKSTNKLTTYQKNPNNPSSLGSNQVQSLFIDKDNTMWIGTFGGGLNYFSLNQLRDNGINFKKYLNNPSDPSSISDNRVYTIYEDKNGTMWIGTFGGGLNKFDKRTGKFVHYKYNSKDLTSLSDNRVMSILEDSEGNFWIGTYGGGLNKFDRHTGKAKRYLAKDGLTSDVVYGILEDRNKNIWISSNNGLFKLNIKTDKIINYDLSDGLQSKEFSGGAYFKAADGEMFFGGIKGLNHFYPGNVVDNNFKPPIVISTIKLFDKVIGGEKSNLDLKFDQNYLTFEFAALSYSAPEDNHYMYMLEGLDKKWQTTTAERRTAIYTNLAPGEYVFKVKGSNNDELWNDKVTTLYIKISPPFWKTWWFVVLFVILLSSFVYYLITLRLKNLLAIEKLKSKLAADLHDSVGSGLTEISILSELSYNQLADVDGGSLQNLKNISDTARQLIDNMSDIVWMVNPKRDSIYDLVIRLKDHYSDLLSAMGISFKVNTPDNLSEIKLSMDYKQNLYLILKEAINNALKHSRCKKIILDVNFRENVLIMSVTDDGSGLRVNEKTFGNGLKNMEDRAKIIGGRITLKTFPQKGLSVTYKGKMHVINKFQRWFFEKSL